MPLSSSLNYGRYLFDLFALFRQANASFVASESHHQASGVDRQIVRGLKRFHRIVDAVVVQKCVAREFRALRIADVDAFGSWEFFLEYRHIQFGW